MLAFSIILAFSHAGGWTSSGIPTWVFYGIMCQLAIVIIVFANRLKKRKKGDDDDDKPVA
jgi:hypothetical protein